MSSDWNSNWSSDSHWIDTPPSAPADSRRPVLARFVAAFAVFALGLGGGVLGGLIVGGSGSGGGTSSPLVTAAPVDPAKVGDTDIARAWKAIAPSVVTIDSIGSSGEAIGTGIIVTSDGEVITNEHVVRNARTVRVRLNGATSAVSARVLASDPGNDLALLKINDASGLTAATFADAASISIGDPVVAVGYALNLDGGPSITAGIVSALDRTLQDENGALNGLIQTDAAISSGNSGGPLINLNGQVVGVNTAVATGGMSSTANNIGFAIGVAEVKRVADILRREAAGEDRPQGYLGIGLRDRNDGGSGAVVAEVESDSPADNAGLRVDDIILEINDQTITGQGALIGIIRDSAPGDEVTITIERDGNRRTLTATLTARPES